MSKGLGFRALDLIHGFGLLLQGLQRLMMESENTKWTLTWTLSLYRRSSGL